MSERRSGQDRDVRKEADVMGKTVADVLVETLASHGIERV
jgi:hypothetical protein